MRNFFRVAISFVMLLTLIILPKVEAANSSAQLVIFHTNDMHARVSQLDDDGRSIGLAEISAAVNVSKLNNPNTLWFDAGDTIHGMPNINISKGENMIKLLNETPLDAIVPGNHDYNYGAARLIELSKQLNATVLSANTIKLGTMKNVFKPYKIYKLPSGIKVGVFGLTTPETAYKSNPKNTKGIEFLNPVEQAQKMVKKLRNKCDVLIAVMHMGVDASSEFTSDRIASEAPGIDLIVDGHSHTALPDGMNVGETLIVQTGWHEYRLGRVQIDVDNHKITGMKAQLLDADEVAKISPTPDPKIASTLKQIEMSNEKLFNEVIAHSEKELSSNRLLVRRHESELGNLAADAFRWRTSADIAIINGGGLRSDLPKGDVTRGDIMSIFPFGNTIQLASVSGKTIREMLEHSVFAYPASFGGFLDVSGMTFSYDPTQPAGKRVVDIYVNGELLDENKTYSLAANDFIFVGGDDYNMLKDVKIIGEFDTCEEILADYLNQVGMNDIEVGRITLTKEVLIPDEQADGEAMREAA